MFSRRRTVIAGIVLLSLALLIGVYLTSRPRPQNNSDLEAAVQVNERGVGRMNAFDYQGASELFAQAEQLAPGWRPAKLNRAIALYNLGGSSENVRASNSEMSIAIGIFESLIADNPDDIAARYNLGIVRLSLNDIAEASEQFERVTELNPSDGHAWLLRYRAAPDGSESPEGRQWLLNALKANPYLNAARYSLAQHALTPVEERTKILSDFNDLAATNADIEYAERYSDMGQYALTISSAPVAPQAFGPLPIFILSSTPSLPVSSSDPLPNAVRQRFGATSIAFDFDRDDRPDILHLDCHGQDRLFRNTPKGNFIDISQNIGLTGASLGVAAGDYNNDGYIDLLLTRPTGVVLLRNEQGKRFVDVTKESGLDQVHGFILTAAWVDLDLDGDLDLLMARTALDPTVAESGLAGGPAPAGQAVLFANVGVSPPNARGARIEALTTRFRPISFLPELAGGVTGFLLSDLDQDLDPDIILFRDDQTPAIILNDRLLRFRLGPELIGVPAGRYNGGVALHANGDDQPDYLLLRQNDPPLLVLSQRDNPDHSDKLADRFQATPLPLPPLQQAWAVDLDRDGRTDLVGLATDGQAVMLQNEGEAQLAPRQNPFGPASAGPWLTMIFGDFNADHRLDFLGRSATEQKLFEGSPNGNHAVQLRLSGIRERREPGSARVLRTNADGLGSTVMASTANTRARIEFLTRSSGLGQSLGPVELGTGTQTAAEVVRLRWPDAMIQAELDQPTGQLLTITETSRKPTSCPVLLVWDGSQFQYATDFLGAGALAETMLDGSIRPPRPEESVAIDASIMKPFQGKYQIKITEPMDEILYFDQATLSVIDHPSDHFVLPDERFTTSGPPASQKTLLFRKSEQRFPQRVTDHDGKDQTQTIHHRDGKTVNDFQTRSWLGYAEEHHVILDFGDTLASLNGQTPCYLVLAGWTDYPFPESIYAANQAGVATIPPVLEQQQTNGDWKVIAEVGFPAGLPRVITRNITGLIDPKAGSLRLRTNLRIYWDQIFIASVSTTNIRETVLPVSNAALQSRGLMQEISDGPGEPILYDPGRVEAVAVTKWVGNLTKLGKVTELVMNHDDRLCISGPGDELTLEFDASRLPQLASGHTRSYILHTRGYTKDTAPTTLTGGTVKPLPFRAMPAYPYPPETTTPHAADEIKWHTRPARGR